MPYSIEGLDKSRGKGFADRKLFGMVLKEFLHLSASMKILDAGCGTGFFTRILAEQTGADITGIDINTTLLKGARELAARQNLTIKFEQCDITNIPYPDNFFDIAMCDIMLECFEDITQPLLEMKRVCKPGGLVAAIEPFYQASVEYYPDTDNKTRDLIQKFSRADKAFGVGPMLPGLFHKIGLGDIDMTGWFCGSVGYRSLAMETPEEKINSMTENLKRIKEHAHQQLTPLEKYDVVHFFENRINGYKKDPSRLKQDMSVQGLPVFIVKGTKKENQHGI